MNDMSHAFDPTDFSRRHIGPSPDDVDKMVATLGAASLDALIDETLPRAIRQPARLALGRPLTEAEALRKLRVTAGKNRALVSLIGQGYYGTVLPGVIQRNILE